MSHALDKVSSALLQDEGRGWRIDLFADDNVKMEYKCDYCLNICKNAVELSCDVDHDDDTLQLYCEYCLKEVIASNNNTCPIDKHSNPTYASARRVRGKINKAKVLCPNSAVYKQQKSKDKNVAKGNIMVETSDEKEGMNVNVNINDNNNELKGCDFKGNLSELINHISKCCESNLDSKELQTEIIKVLRNDINELKKNNKHIQDTLAIQNNVIDQLKKQNQNLVQQIKRSDKSQSKMSTELKNGMNELKNENQTTTRTLTTQNNSINELKKQNKNLLKQYTDMSETFVTMSQQYEQQKKRINKLENIVKMQNEEAKEEKERFEAVDLKILCKTDIQQLLKWLPGNKPKLQLLYRASRDGYDHKKYYEKIGNKSPTVCIIRTDKDYVFGGYTCVAVPSNIKSNKSYKDDTAFIFLLRSKGTVQFQKWQIQKNAEYAFYTHTDYGPVFGTGHAFYLDSNMKQGWNTSCGAFNINTTISGQSSYKVVDVEAYCVV